ncbi:hypothetical protein ILUMI_01235 [Ignelater luminosus]|uniref:PiggyBac transposable element-derived protein domain-containing protein n=1 Tax=Ignelater luminosus TaxID=2038154 RepID=A0A8K0DIW6_IGNLU|nr:hypothetical protein ILUMI_01235 [Ignelater luminosus]
MASGLHVINEENDIPTFLSIRGESNIDLTVGNDSFISYIKAWQCDKEETDKCAKLIASLLRSARVNWGLKHEVLKPIYKGAIIHLLSYGIPVWAKALTKKKNQKKLERLQRIINIRISKYCRTLSYEASCIVAAETPIIIKLKEVARTYEMVQSWIHPADFPNIQEMQDGEVYEFEVYTDGSKRVGKLLVGLSTCQHNWEQVSGPGSEGRNRTSRRGRCVSQCTKKIRYYKKALSLKEIKEVLEDDFYYDNLEISNNIDIVIILRDVDELSEEFDDDVRLNDVPSVDEVVKRLEIHAIIKESNISTNPLWEKQKSSYSKFENSETEYKTGSEDIIKKYGNHTELFQEILKSDVCERIVKKTVRYSASKIESSSIFSTDELNSFLGILLLSGYIALPLERMYWSNDDDLGCPVIKATMNQNRFTNYDAISSLATVHKYCRKKKKKIPVSQPAAIKSYNKSMGGVDQHDRVAGYGCCRFLNTLQAYTTHGRFALSLVELRRSIGLTLQKRRVKSKRTQGPSAPTPGICYDQKIPYYFAKRDKQRRRQLEGCRSAPHTYCVTCNVTFCVERFSTYHNH